jgi:hypothetical protein
MLKVDARGCDGFVRSTESVVELPCGGPALGNVGEYMSWHEIERTNSPTAFTELRFHCAARIYVFNLPSPCAVQDLYGMT